MASVPFDFASHYDAKALDHFDQHFVENLAREDRDLYQQLLVYRAAELSDAELSDFLIALAVSIERTLVGVFDIETEMLALSSSVTSNDHIFHFKKMFVARLAKRKLSQQVAMQDFASLDAWLDSVLTVNAISASDRESAVAKLGVSLLKNPEQHAQAIELLTDWSVQAMCTPEGRAATAGWVSLRLPNKCDFQHLVPTQPLEGDFGIEGVAEVVHREGFSLTDERMSLREIQNEVHYCVYCHDKDGDFCRTGFPVKKKQPELGLKKDAFNQPQTGCPLEERVSEAHLLQRDGYTLAALVMIMRDNPMCPATGHRICNDCMKACIYQKQDPVNIPQIETGILSEVLKLPWGVEIFNLLLRWNPLRHQQSVLHAYAGKKVAVMGMGPAGFSLAYHLLMEGCAVVGLDGLKIEPLPHDLVTKPIEDYNNLVEDLEKRITWGFGGVAEYGITVRWDKNFLTLLYLSLCRFQHFQVFGAVRFGGTFQVEDAWRLGFDHLAVAVGAGLPRELPIPGSLAVGMRQANDFLMALQLTGAAKRSHMANLQVSLPAVVVGGGLTAVDTATEVQAYYLVQIEKVMQRVETLKKILGEEKFWSHFKSVDQAALDQWLMHAEELRAERQLAQQLGRKPNVDALLKRWGGVTIVYRRSMQESPAYKRNHEELIRALGEGVGYLGHHEPLAALCDDHGHIVALQCRKRLPDGVTHEQNLVDLPARSVFVATGAKPNVAYSFEHRDTFARQGYEYQAFQDINGELLVSPIAEHCKSSFGAFTSYGQGDKRVSFLGDTHPLFHGSVVKAIASAKRIYPAVMSVLSQHTVEGDDYATFAANMQDYFAAKVLSRQVLSERHVELVIQSPAAVCHFQPGHLYRLQPWETRAQWLGETCLLGESKALVGTKVCRDQGTVTVVVPQDSVAGRLAALLRPGDQWLDGANGHYV